MNTHAMPLPASSATSCWICGLGADVDAAGGLVEDQQLGLGDQPAGEQHLLLVAAGEVAHRARRGRPAGCRAPRCTGRPARPASPRGIGRSQPRRGLQREHHVLGDGQVLDDALGAAVLGRERDAVRRWPAAGVRSLRRARRGPSSLPASAGRRRRAAGPARCGRSRAVRRGPRPRRRRPPGPPGRRRPCDPRRGPRETAWTPPARRPPRTPHGRGPRARPAPRGAPRAMRESVNVNTLQRRAPEGPLGL